MTAIIGACVVLVGSALAWAVQTSAGSVAVKDVRFPSGDLTMSGLLYVPKGVDAAHPAPAVLISHGLINTREMQSPFAIELSRRGFVVLAMDMTGHGYSGGTIGENGFGGPDALAYLRALPYVDKNRIGLEGHSLGGAPVLSAARAYPDGYSAIVLEGSSTSIAGRGAPGAAPFVPRNIAVVFGQYDEFSTMWRVDKGSKVPASPQLKELFGTDQDVVVGKLYGSIEDGTARLLRNPPVTHPMEHFSQAGIAGTVDWFERTLPGAANPLPPGQQIWLWKEIGTLTGFIGCVILILGAFRGLLTTRPFAVLAQAGQPPAERRGAKWWLAFVLTAAIPALTYFPLMENGTKIFMGTFGLVGLGDWARGVFTEQVTNQLVVWALVNGLVTFALSFVLRGAKPAMNHRWIPAIGASILAVGAGYLSLVLADLLFKVDFRFWVLALKPFDARHFGFFLLYLAPFLAFFLLAVRGFDGALPVRGERAWVAAVVGGLAMCLGFVILHLVQYGSLFATGRLFHDSALFSIVAHQFIPLLFVIGVVAALTFRWTNSYVSGAFICALFITWYVVSGTAVYGAGGILGARPPAPAAAPPAAPAAASGGETPAEPAAAAPAAQGG